MRKGAVFTPNAPEAVWRPGSGPAGGAYNSPSHPVVAFNGWGSRVGKCNGKAEREGENARGGTEGGKEEKGNGGE